MGILNGTTLMMAGLAVLTAAATTVGVVTLVKNIQQEKKLQEVKNDIVTIENNNQYTVKGLNDKLDENSKEQKEANKKNNAELVSAKNELSEAQKKLDLAKSVLNVVEKDYCELIDTVVAASVGANAMYLDMAKFPFLTGGGAVAFAADNGIHTVQLLCDHIKDAMKNYTRSNMQPDANAQEVAGRLMARAAAQLQAHEGQNLKTQARMEARQRFDDAKAAFDEAQAKVVAIEAALA